MDYPSSWGRRNLQQQKWAVWQELLPGIEEFLTDTLGQEHLSLAAEERRQFFLERLDIIKLPPSLPPREGRILSPELLKETEQTSGVPSLLSSPGVAAVVCPDFAAAQRQIARSQAGQDGSASGSAGSSETPDGEDTLLSTGMKVYDDIDLPDCSETHPSLPVSSTVNATPDFNADIDDSINNNDNACCGANLTNENNDNSHHYESGQDDDEENDHYEIPVARQQLPSITDDSVGEPASPSRTLDGSMSIPNKPGSVEELFESGSADGVINTPPPLPPPLPPRRDVNVRWSDSELRSPCGGSFEGSGGSGGGGGKWSGSGSGDVPPELPFRPPQLPRRGEIVLSSGALKSDKSEHSEKSDDRSDGDISDGGSTSYESFDEDHDQQDSKMTTKLNIKLPAKPQKKTPLGSKKISGPGLTKKSQRPSSKSRLSSQWEVSAPFKQLENIDISGELYHRGKLSWNKRVVAIIGGSLVMYKPEKEGSRPSLVLQLSGYSAMVSDREGRRGYEIRLTHPCDDSHTFAVDFREWAHLWAEHINGTAKGQPPPKYHTHLARTFPGGETATAQATGTKKHRLKDKGNVDLAGYGAACPNEIEALFNSMDSDREEGVINETSDTKRRGPFLSNTMHRGRTMVSKRFHANSSPKLLVRSKTLDASPSQRAPWKAGDGSVPKEGPGKSIGAAMKEILVRRQRGLFKVTPDAHDSGTGISGVGTYNRKSSAVEASDSHSSPGLVSKGSFRLMPSSDRAKEASHHQGRRPLKDKLGPTYSDPLKYGQQSDAVLGCSSDDRYECITPKLTRGHSSDIEDVTRHVGGNFTSHEGAPIKDATSESLTGAPVSSSGQNNLLVPDLPPLPLPVTRWDWKSLLLAWSAPLDQILTALKVSDITASNSNLSTGSEGTGDEGSKPKLRGNKVIRMGSFAYKATQFFETIGKKTTLKRKSSHPEGNANGASATAKSEIRRQHQLLSKTSSSSFGDLRNGIVEESSQVSPSGSIGLGMSAVSPTSECSLPPSFSLPASNSDACSIGDRSTSLSGSGTPSQDSPLALWSATSRQRSKSGGGSMGGDSLDLEGEENGDGDPFLGVSHKGYLYVFSSFNKRRWGQRWCVIRTNWFECYHQRRSKVAPQGRHVHQGEERWNTCELSFLLRPCMLRRAVKETGSELGLMLVEDGKEKITVEALSSEEMGAWVRAILPETSNSGVPEGLEDFLKEIRSPEADSGSVLQQWGLDAFVHGSSNDYEDPQESVDVPASSNNQENDHRSTGCAAESFVDESFNCDSTLVTSSCFLADEEKSGDTTLVPSCVEKGETKVDISQDVPWNSQSASLAGVLANVCRTSPGTKNTDSGCYSGRGANSDSDSGCENSSGGRDTVDPDGGYATLDSACNILKLAAKQLNLEKTSNGSEKDSKTDYPVVMGDEKASSVCEGSAEGEVSEPCSAKVFPDATTLISPQTEVIKPVDGTVVPSCSYFPECSTSPPSHTSSSNQPSTIPPRVPCEHSTDMGDDVSAATLPSTNTSYPNISNSSLPQSKISCSSDIPSVQAPSGEEYSLVVKRSDRTSLEIESSQTTSCRSSGGSSIATLTSACGSAFSHNHSFSSLIETESVELNRESTALQNSKGISEDSQNDGEEEDDNVFQSMMVVGSDSANVKMFTEDGDNMEIRAEIEHELTLSCNNNSEPLYEPIGQGACVQNKGLCGSSQQFIHNPSASQFCLEKDIKSTDPSSSLCIDAEPTKSLLGLETGDCGMLNEHGSERKTPSGMSLESAVQSDNGNKCEHNEVLLDSDAKNESINDCDKEERCSSNSKETALRISIPVLDSAGNLHPISNLAAISPSADWVSSMLENPGTTTKDLQQAMQRLKDKQGEIRRKRMAVHDKRQRASSDGERLACEKEMAALEKLGQNTESDVRDLKNKLAVLQGESLDVLCGATNQLQARDQGQGEGQPKARGQGEGQGQGKRSKSGSRKRKQKRKS